MSHEKEALEYVAQHVTASQQEIAKKTDFPIAAVPGGMSIKGLEQFMEKRNQFRGQLSTHLVKDFADYANLQEDGSCFINRDHMSATAIFDIGSIEKPGHCNHSAYVNLKNTAAYRAVLDLDGSRVNQQTLAEFVEDWKDNLNVYVTLDAEPLDNRDASAAIREVTVKEQAQADHGVQSFSTSKSTMEQLDATSKDKPLPGFIKFKCEPFVALREYEIIMRISMLIQRHEKPMFIVRSIKLEEVQEAMSDEFIELVQKELGADTKLKTYIGSFNTD